MFHSTRAFMVIGVMLALLVPGWSAWSAQANGTAPPVGLLRLATDGVQAPAGDPSARTGIQPDGTSLLVTNWSVGPAGRQTPLGDLPLNAALSPDGRHLLVTNGGLGVQSLQVVDLTSGAVIQTIPYYAPASAFVGLTYSPDGTRAYAAGGGSNVVHFYTVAADGLLTAAGDVTLHGFAPAVAQNNGCFRVSCVTPADDNPFPTGLAVSGDGRTLYVANNLSNVVAFIDTATQTVRATVPVGNYPYMPVVSPTTGYLYVSNWGDATLSEIDPVSRTVVATIPVGQHPCALAFGPDGLLYVADANSDAVSVVDPLARKEIRRVSVHLTQGEPLSSSPQGLALSPDGRTLYVANAGDNDVAVFSLDPATHEILLQGLIPAGWYPTALVIAPDGRTLFIVNGLGVGEGPNSTGLYPDPLRSHPPIIDTVQGLNDQYCNCTFDKFAGAMTVGTLSTVPVPTPGELHDDTLAVVGRNHVFDTAVRERSPDNPVPVPGSTSPIKHVIYVIRENRTYDQYMGDEQVGDGDPSLALFGRKLTPNGHALAERFGIMDNYYTDAQVSPEGHNWVMGAVASDYNEKMWPQSESPGQGRNRPYDFEGGSTINSDAGGYLWDIAAEAGVSYRDYGEFYAYASPASQGSMLPAAKADTCDGPLSTQYTDVNIPAGSVLCLQPSQVDTSVVPRLAGHYDPRYRGYDMRYTDGNRIDEWAREFQQFVAGDNLPQLELVRLPNDHTAGSYPGHPTPQTFVSESDAALARLVDTVSHSKYWSSTAVFVTEDDAQNGPDHVDSHRSFSLVVSPYTSASTPRADHTHYDTAALDRTIELILGLRPMSKFDARATPMWRLFNAKPDVAPYSALPETQPFALNTPASFGARASTRMNWSIADAAPMDEVNRIIWGAVKGTRVPYGSTRGGTSVPSGYLWGALQRRLLSQPAYVGFPRLNPVRR